MANSSSSLTSNLKSSRLKRPTQFWLSLHAQFGLFLTTLLLSLFFTSIKWPLFICCVVLLISIAVTIKTISDERIERLKVFEKGNVPAVKNANLFSGNIFEVFAVRESLYTINQLHKHLGKTFGMFYATDAWIFTTDLDLLQRLFITEGTKFIDRNNWRMPFVTEFNKSVVAVNGDDWRRTRRILGPSFTSHQMRSDNVFKDIERASDVFLDCIAGHPVEQQQEDANDYICRLVDVNYNFKKFTADVIFRVAYGTENGINMKPMAHDRLIDAIEEAAPHIRGPFALIAIMFESLQKALGHLVQFSPIGSYIQYIHSVLDRSLRERRKLSATASPANKLDRKMIDSIIESFAKGQMSEERLRANLFFIFIAGAETSSNTLTAAFWLLANHQDIQDKLRKAIAVDGSQAQYLDWCVRETLRLYPAVPTAIGRVIHEDIEWKGQTFFAGTTINASIYAIHHSPDIWGPDVEEFKPERFASASSFHPMQEYSFGHGPRNCIGKQLAEFEIRSIIPKLLLKYRLEPTKKTPKTLHITAQNLIHMLIHGRVELKFIELNSL